MERLETVIAKAQELGSDATFKTSRHRMEPLAAQRGADQTSCQESWAKLTPLDVTPRLMRKSRLVSFFGGTDAVPYDMLRTRILRQAAKNGWRRVAITSPDSACGKSTIAANVAFSLGRQSDIRALVLDFDLRRAGLSRMLGQRPDPAIADFLAGNTEFADVAVRYGTNVALGLGRAGVRNPAELLQSERTPALLSALEDAYQPDVILFDLPPMMASDDNFAFLHNVDCALIVAAAERTSLDRIDVAERHVANLTSVMGLVLNRTRYSSQGAHGYEYNYY